jgi:hypothetical protein
MTTETASSTSSDKDDGSWADVDFSRLNDTRALHHFVNIYDYLLNGDDSDYSAMSSCGHDAKRWRLHTASTRHDW